MIFTRLHSKSFLLPTALTILFIATLLILLGSGERKHVPLWRTLIQWDGQHYLAIAAAGYEKFPCPDNPGLICGNVGWFPLYPMAARAVGAVLGPLGLDMHWSILVTAWLSLWLALLLLYRLLVRRFDPGVATTTLIALMLFPTSFYFLTAFPYALYLLLAVSVFLLLDQRRYLLCALPAGLLAVTYPSGVTIALPLLWVLLAEWKTLSRSDRASLIASIAAVPLALALYGLYYYIRFDDFFLYVHFQSKPYYAHEPALPLIPIFDSLLNLPGAHPIRVILIFTAALLALFYSRRIPVSWQIFMWSVLLFTPTAGTTTSYYRHIIVAFPLYVMIALSLHSPHRRFLLPLYILAGVTLIIVLYMKYYKLGQLM